MIQLAPGHEHVVEQFDEPRPCPWNEPGAPAPAHLGYTPDLADIERFVQDELPLRSLGESPWYGDMRARAERRDAFLWAPLLEQLPTWRRGAQGIGDCVSWGWELGGTAFLYGLRKLGEVDMPLVTGATESIYGGSRVEARGGRLGGWSDGSYGGAAARWLNQWGFLLRLDYSSETGSADDDLRKYDSKRAKSWGNYGCGGADDEGRDKGQLDQIARRYPMTTTAIRTTDELAAAVANGYPVPTCSGVGFGNRGRFHTQRNADGVARIAMGWNHCEVFWGLRWVGGKPQFRMCNSWGKCASGPDPGIDDEAVSLASWWVVEEDAARILRAKDTFAITGADGFVPRSLDWTYVSTNANAPRSPGGPDWVQAA